MGPLFLPRLSRNRLLLPMLGTLSTPWLAARSLTIRVRPINPWSNEIVNTPNDKIRQNTTRSSKQSHQRDEHTHPFTSVYVRLRSHVADIARLLEIAGVTAGRNSKQSVTDNFGRDNIIPIHKLQQVAMWKIFKNEHETTHCRIINFWSKTKLFQNARLVRLSFHFFVFLWAHRPWWAWSSSSIPTMSGLN